jgi:DNA polymerase-3 subunit delta'
MDWNILGHEWAVSLLQAHVTQGDHHHAYLFTGPMGVGRRTLAIRFTQALNCTKHTSAGGPCLECHTCKRIEKMQHPDLAVVQTEHPGEILKIEQIRKLGPSLSLAPYEARYRVALLLRFEEANQNAANALLKTLEEPPARVVLILTAESSDRLLPTIVSRCEVLRLRPLPLDTLQDGLQTHWAVPAQDAKLLAHLSGGRPGYALRLFHDPKQLEQRHSRIKQMYQLLSASRVERFGEGEKLAKDKDNLRQTLRLWMSVWRDVMLKSAGANAPLTNLDQADKVAHLAASCGLAEAQKMVSRIQRTLDLLDRNINTRLATEVLLLDFPKVRMTEEIPQPLES